MTQITEIAPDIYRISTFVPEGNLQFNQFLVRDEQPLLFHRPLDQIGNVAFNHQNYAVAQAAYDACQSAACDYFSNYYEGHAPAGANRLKRMLGQSIVDPSDLEDQPSLF